VIIFSDDPDAIEKLVDKIERLKNRQGVMKRKQTILSAKRIAKTSADLGFSEETIAKLFAQDFGGRAGFPNYTLANNSANIRRLEKRLAVIQNAQHDETTEEQLPDGVPLVVTLRRIDSKSFSLRFPRKRSVENSSATAFAGPRLPELGNGSNRATYLAKLILSNHTP
jgi:hypothetical protein